LPKKAKKKKLKEMYECPICEKVWAKSKGIECPYCKKQGDIVKGMPFTI